MDLFKIVLIVFIAELPCMVRTVALQLQNGSIWSVIWGTILGSALALAGGLIISKILECGFALAIHSQVNWIAGGILICLGLYMMFFGE